MTHEITSPTAAGFIKHLYPSEGVFGPFRRKLLPMLGNRRKIILYNALIVIIGILFAVICHKCSPSAELFPEIATPVLLVAYNGYKVYSYFTKNLDMEEASFVIWSVEHDVVTLKVAKEWLENLPETEAPWKGNIMLPQLESQTPASPKECIIT